MSPRWRGGGIRMSQSGIVALVALALAAPLLLTPGRTAEAQTSPPPNILVVITDDQRAQGTLRVMPKTRYWLERVGTRFPNAFAASPLCCPSRTSMMTGRYPHNHGVRRNGAYRALDLDTTVQRYLDDAGYRTGLYGKFLIKWDLTDPPPDFDDWALGRIGVGYRRSSYYGGTWNVNGNVKTIDTYSTDYIARRAVRFVRRSEAEDEQPWYAYLAPAAPHVPSIPEASYARAPVREWAGNRAVFETDRSDKPPWVHSREMTLDRVQWRRRRQLRTLMSVDDLVHRVMTSLRELGEARNTLVFFMSDNGHLWSEHGLFAKRHPYEQSVEIPFLVRWPGHIARGVRDERVISNVDVMPTILEAAGLQPDPDTPVDGQSLLSSGPRSRVLIEYGKDAGDTPEWAAIRTRTAHYVEYYEDGAVTFSEYYDLKNDRWELENLLGDEDVSNDSSAATLQEMLVQDRSCAGATCP